MRRHLVRTIVLVLALPFQPHSAAAGNPPPALNRSAEPAPGEKHLDWLAFDAAAEQAKKANKHLVVDIYTTWCGWCKVMDRQTYGNAEIADYLTQNFVLTKVNGESSSRLHWQGKVMTEREFARAVGVTGFPTTFFLKPDAEIVGGRPGFIQAKEFLMIARYVGTRWYEKGKFQDFVEANEEPKVPEKQ